MKPNNIMIIENKNKSNLDKWFLDKIIDEEPCIDFKLIC